MNSELLLNNFSSCKPELLEVKFINLHTIAIIETRVANALAASILMEPAVARRPNAVARILALAQRHALCHIGHRTVHGRGGSIDVDAVVMARVPMAVRLVCEMQ